MHLQEKVFLMSIIHVTNILTSIYLIFEYELISCTFQVINKKEFQLDFLQNPMYLLVVLICQNHPILSREIDVNHINLASKICYQPTFG